MDIALNYFINKRLIDVSMDGPDLKVDEDLATSIIISLFTDRLANSDDVLPVGVEDRRGWWGDTYNPIAGDLHGSRLWLLYREKLIPEVLIKARTYCYEALQWLVEDNIAHSILVTTAKVSNDILGIQVDVQKPQGIQTFKFQYVWGQLDGNV